MGRREDKERWKGLPINDKKERYCQLRAAGNSQRQSYLEAFPNSRRWKPETVDNKACALERDGEVLARLKELRHDNESKAGLTRRNILEKLEGIINTEDVQFRGTDVLKAIELYASLCGYDAPQDNANGRLMALIEGLKHG